MNNVIIEEITRIEGHLNFTIELGEHIRAKAEAMEGIRLLEDILVGKYYWDIPDITSRMCGVCQAIHRLTSIQALEDAFNIELPYELGIARELVAIAGHIQSHILHLHFFVLPDLHYKRSIIDLIPSHKELVMKAIRVKKVMDEIVKLYGGRVVHPITPVVGGFAELPSKDISSQYLNKLKKVYRDAVEITEAILNVSWPDFKRETAYLSLKGKGIPLLNGTLHANGLSFIAKDYEKYIKAVIEEYSTARHYLLNNREYFVGALARLNNNYNELSENAAELMEKYGYKFPSANTFHNNVAQALEIIHYIDRAIEILKELSSTDVKKTMVKYNVTEGYGVSATEAPRGLLIHAYKVDNNGRIVMARIITPTAQNYKNMERDVEAYVELMVNNNGIVKRDIEMLIRAYDPCVSCSARFITI